MANILETGFHYVGRVVERSLGVAAVRDQIAVLNSLSSKHPPEWIEQARRETEWNTGPRLFLHQLLLPAIFRSRAAFYYMDSQIDRELYPIIPPPEPVTGKLKYMLEYASRLAPSLYLDAAMFTGAAALSHNPLEFVAWKLAANAATNVGVDLVEAVTKGITHLRSPNITIAV